MGTVAAHDKPADRLAEAEAAAVDRIERGELVPPVHIDGPDGMPVSVIDREGGQVVVSRQPRWRHGACPRCVSPIVRVVTHNADGTPFSSAYRCSMLDCDYEAHDGTS
jgi:hypothetical protein